jgi:cation transport ATPase
LAASLAMTGLIGPLIAAILMPVSSLTVLTLAFGSRTFRNTTNVGKVAAEPAERMLE